MYKGKTEFVSPAVQLSLQVTTIFPFVFFFQIPQSGFCINTADFGCFLLATWCFAEKSVSGDSNHRWIADIMALSVLPVLHH